jgi:hypothetical protein
MYNSNLELKQKKVLNLQVHFLQLNEFISTPYIIYYRRLNIYLEC